ncbi:mobilome CxxCx(11)CxxC protein [Algoriphagus sp. D3-2-R+10]|uniref:mobilome CxxCx(11)CxxC protein n=1 Tax=Algoriphagus aurantiacus TaxID=3103948 RepID=UPI002B3F851F|nr:mobilome CxxCx(11)CxxC protein [Algoriphagus sp. D3-2-R+10]MEB2774604.1 mobilome CxxCx(11)CxxC protein [Algoriphagus sp. D3-2-R+10]
MKSENTDIEKLRIYCHDVSFHSFGKTYIFQKRVGAYTKLINFNTVLGIIIPVCIGATVLGYGIENQFLQYLILVAIPLSIFQLLVSTISVAFKWSDELSYASEAIQSHQYISDRFKKLAAFSKNSFDDLDREYEILNAVLQSRKDQDSKHNLKDWELRMGMRYALREFQRECVSCKKVPLSMESTTCPVCGNFDNLMYKLL